MGATVRGVEVVPVRVEVVVSGGLPGMAIVGMPDAAIQEARERVRAALDPLLAGRLMGELVSLPQLVQDLLFFERG